MARAPSVESGALPLGSLAGYAGELAELFDVLSQASAGDLPFDALTRLDGIATTICAARVSSATRTERLHRVATDLAEAIRTALRNEPDTLEPVLRRLSGLRRLVQASG